MLTCPCPASPVSSPVSASGRGCPSRARSLGGAEPALGRGCGLRRLHRRGGLISFSVPCRGSGWRPTISTAPCFSQHEVSHPAGAAQGQGLQGPSAPGLSSQPTLSTAAVRSLSGGQRVIAHGALHALASSASPCFGEEARGGRPHLAGADTEALRRSANEGHTWAQGQGCPSIPPRVRP